MVVLSLVIVLTWGSTERPHPLRSAGWGACSYSLQGSQALVWCTLKVTGASPQHLLGMRLLGCGVTPLALGISCLQHLEALERLRQH